MTWTHGATLYSECEGGVMVPLNGVCHKCRRTTGRAKQRPSIMWKVDGKRVASAKLHEILAA